MTGLIEFFSISTRLVITKSSKAATYHKGISPIKSYDDLITRYREVVHIEKVISSFPEYLWSPNWAKWLLTAPTHKVT